MSRITIEITGMAKIAWGSLDWHTLLSLPAYAGTENHQKSSQYTLAFTGWRRQIDPNLNGGGSGSRVQYECARLY